MLEIKNDFMYDVTLVIFYRSYQLKLLFFSTCKAFLAGKTAGQLAGAEIDMCFSLTLLVR